MARNTSFTLSDHFVDFINEQVASGRYGSASEVVREGLRLVEIQQRELEWLRAEVEVGLADLREDRIHHDSDALWDGIEQRARKRIGAATPGAGNGVS
jgi:antitoxin ParD1/3/4